MKPNRQSRRTDIRKACARLLRIVILTGLWGVSCTPRPALEPPSQVKLLPQGSRVVAAGVLKGDMTMRTKVQSDLRIVKVAGGQITIGFEGYRMPDRTGVPQYEVKAVASRIGGMVVPVVSVDSFTAGGIVLKVTDPEGKMPLPLKYMAEHEFSIEVSEAPSR
jgi:hypothetical protein